MNSRWIFPAESPWTWLIPTACLLLVLVFWWLEFRKKQPLAWLRIILISLALFALMMAGLKPAYRAELSSSMAILYQQGASPQKRDSLQAAYPKAVTYTLGRLKKGAENYIPHVSYLQQHLPAGSRVFLLGQGLNRDELEYLKAYELHFLPDKFKEGMLELNFPSCLQENDTLKVNTRIQLREDSLLLRLSLAGKGLDSILAGGNGQKMLQLKTVPRSTGDLLYRLDLIKQEQDTLQTLDLPVKIAAASPVKIALLTGYPSFEFKTLKNWLGEQGHEVYFQAEMAPDRYTREWLNFSGEKPYGLNPELLGSVNLLVTDQTYWNSISAKKKEAVEKAVKEEGLGFLLLTSGSSWNPESEGWKGLPSLAVNSDLLNAAVKLPPGESLDLQLPHYRSETEKWLPLLADENGERAVVFSLQGLGRVGFSLIQESFPLVLNNREEAYNFLWSSILNQLARKKEEPKEIEVDFPLISGDKQLVKLWQVNNFAPELRMTEPNGKEWALPLIQDPHIPDLWTGSWWPRERGIYTLQSGKDTLSIPVLSASSLEGIRNYKRLKGTYAFGMDRQSSILQVESTNPQIQFREIALIWWYLLFLGSMAGLWIEQKVRGW